MFDLPPSPALPGRSLAVPHKLDPGCMPHPGCAPVERRAFEQLVSLRSTWLYAPLRRE
jgi:hypothetical protein